MFTLTSFSKQSASWRVLEICVLCAQSTDSQKTYSVNTLVPAATASTGGGGGNNLLGGNNGKDPKSICIFVESNQYIVCSAKSIFVLVHGRYCRTMLKFFQLFTGTSCWRITLNEATDRKKTDVKRAFSLIFDHRDQLSKIQYLTEHNCILTRGLHLL